ncbi:hypothetical protein PTKIN_Ptkin13bG0237200 [Pterospermum kingtungense]
MAMAAKSEKRLFVRFNEPSMYRFFRLDLDDRDGEEAEGKPRFRFDFEKPTGPHGFATILTMGKFIYVFFNDCTWRGAYSPQSNGFEWVEIAKMLAGKRENPAALVVGGKIYVFGGVSSKGSDPFAEVYDPDSDKWEALPDPPDHLRTTVILFASAPDPDDCQKQIVLIHLRRNRSLFAFRVDDQSWSSFDPDFGTGDSLEPIMFRGPRRGPAVVVGDLLLSSGGCCVWAYNLRDRKWVRPCVWVPDESEIDFCSCGKPSLIDLGNGEIGFVWVDTPIINNGAGRLVNWFKLSLGRTAEGNPIVRKKQGPYCNFFRDHYYADCFAF